MRVLLLFALSSVAILHAQDPQPDLPFPSCKVGPVRLDPGGFVEVINDYRTASTNDSVSTKFESIPLHPTDSADVASWSHSRLFLKAETPFARGLLTGYYEIDFLTARRTTPYRNRQYWASYRLGKWQILGGRTWSMLRPNRTGTASESGLMNTLVIEPNYHVGLAGQRRPQLRLTREIGAYQVAFAFESGGRLTGKLTHDGKRTHLEAAVLAGTRDRRGVSLAGVFKATPWLHIVSQEVWSQGEGTEFVGLLPARVHAHATIQGIEAPVRKTVTLYSYGGIVYGARSSGARTIREWTVGGRKQIFPGIAEGALIVSAEYSQADRSLWSGRHGAMNTFMTAIRYNLPASR